MMRRHIIFEKHSQYSDTYIQNRCFHQTETGKYLHFHNQTKNINERWMVNCQYLEKSTHNSLMILSSSFTLPFLPALSLICPIQNKKLCACSSLPPLVCCLLCLSDLDLHFLTFWFALSLSNSLNSSQFPFHASYHFSLPLDVLLTFLYFVCLSLCLTAKSSSLWKAGCTRWTWLSWTLMPAKQHSALSLTREYDTNRGLPATLSFCLR